MLAKGGLGVLCISQIREMLELWFLQWTRILMGQTKVPWRDVMQKNAKNERSFKKMNIDFDNFLIFLEPVTVLTHSWKILRIRLSESRAISSNLWDVTFGPPCILILTFFRFTWKWCWRVLKICPSCSQSAQVWVCSGSPPFLGGITSWAVQPALHPNSYQPCWHYHFKYHRYKL